MSDNLDTIDIIVDDMLNDGHTGPADSLEWVQAKMKFYADRIKAVWKRDAAIHAMTCEANERLREHLEIALENDKRTVGNAAAMREALEKCRALAETIWQSEGGWDVSAEIAELKDIISAALAAPLRNCDIYTDIDSAFRACQEDRGYLKSPIDERRSVISFMLSTNTSGEANKYEGEPDESK